jgi:cell division protein FtsN
MWVAIAVCIIGAVLIFRDQGGEVPTGIGEYQTVVTAPDNAPPAVVTDQPRSGDVDINDQAATLTPEKPVDPAPEPVAEKTPVKQAPATVPKTVPVKPQVAQPAAQLIKPAASGPYMVQTGSFGEAANADQEAARLQADGFDARVKVGNTSDNNLIYRVRIGYFKSRTEAEAFIRQNRKIMPGAIPAHR